MNWAEIKYYYRSVIGLSNYVSFFSLTPLAINFYIIHVNFMSGNTYVYK